MTPDSWKLLLQALVEGVRGQLGTNDEKVMAHNLRVAYKRAKEALDREPPHDP